MRDLNEKLENSSGTVLSTASGTASGTALGIASDSVLGATSVTASRTVLETTLHKPHRTNRALRRPTMRDLNKKFGNCLRDNLWVSIANNLGNSLRNSLRNSLADSLWNSLGHSLGHSLEHSLEQTAQNEQSVKETNDA